MRAYCCLLFLFINLHHDFLTLLGFQNQGERTSRVGGAVHKLTLLGFQNQGERRSWVGGAVHKRADSVPGVTEQVCRAVFHVLVGDSQVQKFSVFSFIAFPLIGYPKLPLDPSTLSPFPSMPSLRGSATPAHLLKYGLIPPALRDIVYCNWFIVLIVGLYKLN